MLILFTYHITDFAKSVYDIMIWYDHQDLEDFLDTDTKNPNTYSVFCSVCEASLLIILRISWQASTQFSVCAPNIITICKKNTHTQYQPLYVGSVMTGIYHSIQSCISPALVALTVWLQTIRGYIFFIYDACEKYNDLYSRQTFDTL